MTRENKTATPREFYEKDKDEVAARGKCQWNYEKRVLSLELGDLDSRSLLFTT